MLTYGHLFTCVTHCSTSASDSRTADVWRRLCTRPVTCGDHMWAVKKSLKNPPFLHLVLQESTMKQREFVSLIATSDTGFLPVRTTIDAGTWLAMAHPYVFEKLRVELRPTTINFQHMNLPHGVVITCGDITLRWGHKSVTENVLCNPNMNAEHKLVVGKRVIDELNL